jgi:hypothetical protein
MKAKFEMDLEKALRIAVLLDHHRTDCADKAEGYDKENPLNQRWIAQAGECRQLREDMLKAITSTSSDRSRKKVVST